MRNLILFSFIACIFLHFYTQGQRVEYDELSIKQSSIKKIEPKKTPLHTFKKFHEPAYRAPEKIEAKEEFIASIDSDDIDDEDDLSQLPWDDIEEGWKTHLKEYLSSLDPEKADEIFAAYMEEKKKYVERVDFSDAENGVSQDLSTEEDDREGELERMHVDNLKGIFGDNYSTIEVLHKDYVESVQYLNRSSVKFSISL